jgi:hypothetical protein
MGKFLALIVAVAMVLFLAGPVMAQEENAWTVSKDYTFGKTSTVTATKDIDVDKKVDITVSGELPAEGKIDVQGDVVFKELDVEVQDEQVVSKFFELDDSASSKWTISGEGVMNAAEQFQNGVENTALIAQNPFGGIAPQMNVGLQYQVGDGNFAFIAQQGLEENIVNNFAKQIQFGAGNSADIWQNIVPD